MYTVREFTPNVIEPSFGLGRILYILLEHSFWCREDIERGVSDFRSPSPSQVTCIDMPFQVLSLSLARQQKGNN